MTCGLRFPGLRNDKKWYDKVDSIGSLTSSTFANPFVSRNEEKYSLLYHCSARKLKCNFEWSWRWKQRGFTRARYYREHKRQRHRSLETKRPRQSSIEATAIPRVFHCVTERRGYSLGCRVHQLVITRSSGVWNDVYTYRKRTNASCEIGVLPEYRRFNNHLLLLPSLYMSFEIDVFRRANTGH